MPGPHPDQRNQNPCRRDPGVTVFSGSPGTWRSRAPHRVHAHHAGSCPRADSGFQTGAKSRCRPSTHLTLNCKALNTFRTFGSCPRFTGLDLTLTESSRSPPSVRTTRRMQPPGGQRADGETHPLRLWHSQQPSEDRILHGLCGTIHGNVRAPSAVGLRGPRVWRKVRVGGCLEASFMGVRRAR